MFLTITVLFFGGFLNFNGPIFVAKATSGRYYFPIYFSIS